MTCEGDGSGTLGFFAAKGESVGLVTNKHFAWHHGCKLVDSHGVHIATVEDIAGNVDAAFALCEGNRKIPGMIDVSNNWCKPYEDMKACFCTWKHKGSNDTPHDIYVYIKATDVTEKIRVPTVKITLVKLSMNDKDMNVSNAYTNEVMSKYYDMKTGFKVRCKFSYELSANGTNTVEQFEGRVDGELEGSVHFTNPTDAIQMDNMLITNVEVPVEGRIEGHGNFKGRRMTDGREVHYTWPLILDFKGKAVKHIIFYEGQIRFVVEHTCKDDVGVLGQSGSLLRDKDTNKAVGLVFGGDYPLQGCANPIEDVLEAFGNITKFCIKASH